MTAKFKPNEWNLNHARCDTNRHFRNKKRKKGGRRECLKDKISEPETNNRGIHECKKGFQTVNW
jgi:hypothetical protein